MFGLAFNSSSYYWFLLNIAEKAQPTLKACLSVVLPNVVRIWSIFYLNSWLPQFSCVGKHYGCYWHGIPTSDPLATIPLTRRPFSAEKDQRLMGLKLDVDIRLKIKQMVMVKWILWLWNGTWMYTCFSICRTNEHFVLYETAQWVYYISNPTQYKTQKCILTDMFYPATLIISWEVKEWIKTVCWMINTQESC